MSHRSNLLRSSLLRLAVSVCLSGPMPVVAQTPAEVVINLTAKTKDGSMVEGLRVEDFSVTVDKLPQQIVSFETSGSPVSVGILIDESGSQAGYYKLATKLSAACHRFLQSSDGSNDYFMLAFSSQPRLLQDWRSGVDLVTLTNDLTFEGPTAFYDALYSSIQKVITGSHSRHVIIVFADGQDSFSKRSFNELRTALKNSDVVLYAVGITSSATAGSSLGMEGQGVLDELTTVTGGRAFFPREREVSELGEVWEFIAKEIRSQYRLVIKPEPVAANKWRKIKVKASMRDSTGKLIELRVRARQEFKQ
jgi:Ca-activated chloride channel family protein